MGKVRTLSSKFIFFVLIASLLFVGCNNQEIESQDNQNEQGTSNSQENDASEEVFVAFEDVNLITMTENSVLENQTVIIKDGMIYEIGKAKDTIIPNDAQLINGKGKYLMPGLIDMHVHIHNYKAEEALYLFNGVTGVQNMWGRPEILRMREFNNRRKVGIKIFTTGPIMDGPNPIWEGSLVIDSKEKAREEVIKVKENGYESIKVYELLDMDVYEEIVKTADEIGFRVVGHVPRKVGLEKVLELGQDSIEHLSGYSKSNIENEAKMTAEKNVWNTPTLSVSHIASMGEDIEGLEYVNPQTVEFWKDMTKDLNRDMNVEASQDILRVIHEKGGRILAGTDANNPFVVPGFSLHNELYYLVGAGLTPYEALRAATYNPAEFLGELERLGTVEVGKEADLILLSANPLENINNTKTLEGTMVWGKWNERENLLRNIQR